VSSPFLRLIKYILLEFSLREIRIQLLKEIKCMAQEENGQQFSDVGFEVFTAVVLKSIFFWDMTPCSALSGTIRFGGTYRLHLQGRRKVQQNSELLGYDAV
jgi:hypothetical protein